MFKIREGFVSSSLQIVIRHRGLVIEKLTLEPGDYMIGRGEDCHIHVLHPSIHKHHGRLFHENEDWFYQAAGQKHPQKVGESVALNSHFDLTTLKAAQEETTQDVESALKLFREQRQGRPTVAILLAAIFFMGSGFTYFFMKWWDKPSSPQMLLQSVRPHIVELIKEPDPKAVDDYLQLGGFQKKDFREYYGFCTGFLVAPNVVLTAFHCISGGDLVGTDTSFKVSTYDGQRHEPVQVLGFDALRDFVFLKMNGMARYGHLEWAPAYQVGQTVYTMGNAHGQGIAIREGILASKTPDVNRPEIENIRYSAGASPGNSGGPLLDTQGRIVALVYAATGAENYNLGTPVEVIKEGFDRYVVDASKSQVVSMNPKDLMNFNSQSFLRRQYLPYLNEFNENPDLIEAFKDVVWTVQVPANFKEFSKVLLKEITEKSKAFLDDLQNKLQERNKVTVSWFSYLSEKTPAILFSQFDHSQNVFFKHRGRYVMKVSGFIDSPGQKEFQQYIDQLEREGKFDFQAYGMNTELERPDPKAQMLVYEPENKGNEKKSLEQLSQGTMYVQMTLPRGSSNAYGFKDFMKNYLGDEGVLVSVYTPLMRPNAHKVFNLKELDRIPKEETIKDSNGREWTRYSLKLFEVVHLYVYCMAQPEGRMCTARVFPIQSPDALELLEANFRDRILSHFIENPYFWDSQALMRFLEGPKKEGLRSLQGLKLSQTKDRLQLYLKGFDLTMTLPLEAENIRLQTGLFRQPAGAELWTGYGAQWIQGDKLCGVGVEPKGSRSAFILNYERDVKKQRQLEDDPKKKKDPIPRVYTTQVKTRQGGSFSVFGYCSFLRENPLEEGSYFADLKKAKPYKVRFKKGKPTL